MFQRINNGQLHDFLPHAYPFLLIDYVEKFVKGKTLTAIKNISVNEWPFAGQGDCRTHYPETLLIEASAQSALVLYHLTFEHDPNRPLPIIGKVSAEFSDNVSVGAQIKLEVKAGKIMRKGGYSSIEIFIDEQIMAKVTIIYGVLTRKKTI